MTNAFGQPRGITEAERRLMTHINMFGSKGYPVYRCGSSHWTWGTTDIQGPPVVFNRKKHAVVSFEAYLGVLRDASAGRI